MELDFVVDAFGFGIPMTLKHPLKRKRFLSFSTMVDFTPAADEWIIERGETDDMCCIRRAVPSEFGQQYLGIPNSDNTLGLYTKKGPFTEWTILQIEGDMVTIRYDGRKFNTDDVQLVVAANPTDDIRWVSAYKDITAIYTGRKGRSFLIHIIQEYSAFKNRLFFLDGAPHRNNNTIFYAIDNYDKLTDAIVPLGLLPNLATNKPESNHRSTVIPITKNASYSLNNHINDKLARPMVDAYHKQYRLSMNAITDHFLSRAALPIGGTTYDHTIGGLTAVIPAIIMGHKIEIYKNLLAIVSGELADVNEFIFERLWLHILQNMPKVSNLSAVSAVSAVPKMPAGAKVAAGSMVSAGFMSVAASLLPQASSSNPVPQIRKIRLVPP